MIHKEGYPTIILSTIFSAILLYLTLHFTENCWVHSFAYLLVAFLMVVVLQFFRNPARQTQPIANGILSPADGKVVVIEKVLETEFLKKECMQISVFMSPINVHVNRYPLDGKVEFVQYHPGLFLYAWNPKSSTENERTTIAVTHPTGQKVVFRQIAGALARRIVHYSKVGDNATQGKEFGFIKFGSRVDIFVPLDAKINVELGQKVRGGESLLATLV